MHAEWGAISPRPPTRSMRRAPRAAASSRSAPPRCGCWKARPPKTARSEPFAGDTAIFITPGYRFRAVDILLTNFHLPRSTLFMLVSAFSGLETMKRAYAHAIDSGYRFYSYGDACLLFRASGAGRCAGHRSNLLNGPSIPHGSLICAP